MAHWKAVCSAFRRALSGYPCNVRYDRYWERPVYYVTVYNLSDYDDDDSEAIFDALEDVEDEYDVVQDDLDGDTFTFFG